MNRDVVRRFMLWLSVVIVVGIFVVLMLYSMIITGNALYCPFKQELDIECPGCGVTRMLIALMHFNLYQSFRWNPFVFLTLPLVLGIYIKQSYLFIMQGKMLDYIDTFVFWYLIGFIVFGVIRNIEVFKWLQPTLIV